MTVNHTAPTDSNLYDTEEEVRWIAAQWQSPGPHGIGMAQFASTGTITDALLDDIDRELSSPDRTAEEITGLSALLAYVHASTVSLWTVGSNVAGYMPEGDVAPFLSYADAVEAHREMLSEWVDAWYPEGCECESAEDCETDCDFRSLEATVAAYIADEVPSVIAGRVFGEVRPLLTYLRPEYLPIPRAVWVASEAMTVAEYLESREG